MAKITITALRRIIAEEIQAIQEGSGEDNAADIVSSASKLLKSLEAFKDSTKDKSKVKSELDPHIIEIEKFLKRLISSPMQYVDTPKPVVKKVVSLKPTQEKVI